MGEGFLEEVALPSQLPFCTAGSDAAWAGPACHLCVPAGTGTARGANLLQGLDWL